MGPEYAKSEEDLEQTERFSTWFEAWSSHWLLLWEC